MVIEVEVDSACLPHILPQLCAYSSVHFHIKKKITAHGWQSALYSHSCAEANAKGGHTFGLCSIQL